jgi:hypothetical protein
VLANRFFVRDLPDTFSGASVGVAIATSVGGGVLAGPGMEAAENGVKVLGRPSGLHEQFLYAEPKRIAVRRSKKDEGFLRCIPALVTNKIQISVLERDVTFGCACS